MFRIRQSLLALSVCAVFLSGPSARVSAAPRDSGGSTALNLDVLYDFEVYYEQVTTTYHVTIFDDSYSKTYQFDNYKDAAVFADYASSYLGYEYWMFETSNSEWMLYGTYDTQLSANAIANWLNGWGLNTKIKMVSVLSFSF